MLHQEAIDTNTLELVKRIQSDPELQGFILVGGTALALQIGHRISVDLDFFTKKEFDTEILLEYLEKNYRFKEEFRHQNTLKGTIGNISVDLLRHDYKQVANPVSLEGIKSASKQDIAAMKVNAIAGNGTRVKDFIDIYFLLKEFSFKELIGFYQTKYDSRNDFHAIKSLTYFDDIIVEEWPVMLIEKTLKLDDIKKEILQKQSHFLNIP